MLQTGRVQPIQIMVHTLRPVSYTHLVRQEVKDTKVEDDSFYLLTLAAVAKELKRRGLAEAMVFLAVGPVSYTHLDVYKRQGKDSRCDSCRHTYPKKRKNSSGHVCRHRQGGGDC